MEHAERSLGLQPTRNDNVSANFELDRLSQQHAKRHVDDRSTVSAQRQYASYPWGVGTTCWTDNLNAEPVPIFPGILSPRDQTCHEPSRCWLNTTVRPE
jgi:hypothetical protein